MLAGRRRHRSALHSRRSGVRDLPVSGIGERSFGMPGCVQTLEYQAFLGRWRYSSAPPAPDLAGVVLEYWEVEGRLSPFRERILPNGATEVMINLGPPHTL